MNKKILVTGANGLIGSELCAALIERQYSVRTLSRNQGDCEWDIASGYIDANALDDIDCVAHLAGEAISQRWSTAAKQRILESRVISTQLLTQEIQKQNRPIIFVCASGINYYGHNNSEAVTEKSPPGAGFLAEVCQQWERAAPTNAKHIRTGVVLSPRGGALKKMLPFFKAGLGGRIGLGTQMMSWISLEDVVNIYIQAIEDPNLTGSINAVTPNPVTNAQFTATLGQALRRPTLLPLPAFMVKTLFGEMGNETILANLKVVPAKLQAVDFKWQHAHLNDALKTGVFA